MHVTYQGNNAGWAAFTLAQPTISISLVSEQVVLGKAKGVAHHFTCVLQLVLLLRGLLSLDS
jgi:hypothetical protein